MRARGYGLCDVGFAALYAYAGFVLAPSRSTAFVVALSIVITLLGAAGAALVVQGDGGRASRRLGIVACGVLLAFTVVCLVLLGCSAAFLYGTYGAIGRGLGALTLVVAALVVELFGLLPLFQLRFHLRGSAPTR
ncbi:MAG: hypothetical protein ABI321_25035 [Polyangia bacterium]